MQCNEYGSTDARNSFISSLVIFPSHRKLDRFEAELSKKQSALDNIIDTVAENAQSSKEEAAECLLNSMYRKYEDTFVSVAIAKCVVNEKSQEEEKMDVISTETMIQEANITTKSARIISRHLWQHFGRSFFICIGKRAQKILCRK